MAMYQWQCFAPNGNSDSRPLTVRCPSEKCPSFGKTPGFRRVSCLTQGSNYPCKQLLIKGRVKEVKKAIRSQVLTPS